MDEADISLPGFEVLNSACEARVSELLPEFGMYSIHNTVSIHGVQRVLAGFGLVFCARREEPFVLEQKHQDSMYG